MASDRATLCWPTRYVARWLAVFFGAMLVGVLLGASRTKHPPPPKAGRVQVLLRAREIYTDGSRALVPARLSTGGVGPAAVPESDQGPLSTNPSRLTPLSREPGSRLWLIFTWHGETRQMLINPWPKSSNIAYTVEFRQQHADPHPKRTPAATL